MALEDRCSPQNAPLPTGIPHSPQNTTMYNAAIHHEMSLVVPNGINIKQEQIDDEDEINVVDVVQQTNINFSICNILSDSFGKITQKNKVKNHLFRPYEIKEVEKPVKKSINSIATNLLNSTSYERQIGDQFSHFRLSEVFDLSSKKIENQNLFNNYPKIHEEILSRKYQKTKIAEKGLSKSLGGLCKTVSQIGQPRSPPAPVCLTSPKSESPSSSSQNQQNLRDSGVDSSDDAKSESGSTKEDGTQLWPAWVYCTRYSDRPSSGLLKFLFFTLLFQYSFFSHLFS